MAALLFTVVGTPAPQGSKRHVGNGVMVESSKKVKPWRQDVKAEALAARERYGHETFTGPVRVALFFDLPRPKSHYRTGRNAHQLRDSAPYYVATRPDIDKLVRSSLDALGEAGVWRDDAQVALLRVSKRYCGDGALPGVEVWVVDLDATPEDPPAMAGVAWPNGATT